MVDLVYYLINLLFFDIPLLYYYINLRSLIICYLFSRDIYLYFHISLPSLLFFSSIVTASKLFCREVLETFVILSPILLPIKSPVASSVF